MFRQFQVLCRPVTLISLMTFAVAAYAGTPAAQSVGLGMGKGMAARSVPNVSTSANYRVYVFVRDGIRYIQINDANDVVRAAFAAGNGQYLVLPMGIDAAHVSTPQQPLAITSNGLREKVYADLSTQVYAIPQTGGTWFDVVSSPSTPKMQAAGCDPNGRECTGGDSSMPIQNAN